MSASEEGKARLAFIGAGGFATAHIYPNIHKVPQIDLIAVCDIVQEKAERNARNFGARRVYTDLEKMLDNEELDGVFVIGPAPQQYELAPHVLRRGIPVYVEKPSANTSAEARELAEIAEANDTWGQCGFMKRFAWVYAMTKDIINRPEFGPIHLVNAQCLDLIPPATQKGQRQPRAVQCLGSAFAQDDTALDVRPGLEGDSSR